MKRFFIIAVLCAAMCLTAAETRAAADTAAVPADENTAHSEWLPEFTGVKVSAAIEITFIQVPESEAPRIVYDTKGVPETKFKAAVDKKGVLTISEKIMRDTRSQTTVEVYYHTMESLVLSDAYATFSNPVRQKMMRIDVSGGGKVTVQTELADLEVELSGKNSRAKLTGTARYLEVAASGGIVDASELESMSVEATATYGASVAVRSTERLKTSVSTSGTISYRGTPSIIKEQTSVLGGKVRDVNEPQD